MTIQTGTIIRITRIIAIAALLAGLSDASLLLGVGMGAVSPLATLGVTGFIWLAVFTLARLLASVGLWLGTTWGAVVLLGSGLTELILFLTGSRHISIDAFGFVFRFALLIGVAALLAYWYWRRRAAIHD